MSQLEATRVKESVLNGTGSTRRQPDNPTFDTVEDQFRLLIENAVHITAILDTDGTIRYVSPVVERMLGYSPDALKSTRVFDLVHPEDVDAVVELFNRRVQQRGVGEFIEFRTRHRDGSWRVLEAIATNRLDDPVIAGVVVDARDITERKWSADRLQHNLEAMVAIHEIGQTLGASLEQQAIAAALLDGVQRAAAIEGCAILLRSGRGRLYVTHTSGPGPLLEAARRARLARAARQHVLLSGEPRLYHFSALDQDHKRLAAWVLPLRAQGKLIGVLEVYGADLDADSDNEPLSILADQAAGALERARLYAELAERERRLEELVGRLLLEQEKERRRVAYDIHDGLAQLAAAAHEHLEAFASHYHSRVPRRRIELDTALELMARAVGEARRVIAGLRPTVLDDFGLAMAISFEVQALRSEGWQIDYTDNLAGERFTPMIETVLFRVAQEALANVRKHANTRRVTITLGRHQQDAHLEIRDWGRGFRSDKTFTDAGPSARVGLVGMRERIALLGGRFSIRSRPGAGTRITVEVPLGGRRTKTAA